MDPAQHNPMHGQQVPSPPEPKYEFRWSAFVGVPLAICLFLFLLNGMDPSFRFVDIMNWLNVVQQNHYVRLACLAVLCITVILILKSSGKRPR